MAFITDQLVLKLDASNSSSYPGSGTTWTDLSGNGYNATLTNGPTYSTAKGGFFNFDGTNDYANIPYNSVFAMNSTTQKTVQAWVKFNALETKFFLGNLTGSPSFDGWFMGLDATGRVSLALNSTTETYIRTPTNTVTTDTWYFITGIFRATNVGGTMRLYVNDTQLATGQHTTASFSVGASFNIGTILGGIAGQDNYFNGSIGDVYFYNKGLTTQEVSDNYNATKTRYFQKNVKYYDGSAWQTSSAQKVWNGTAWVDWDNAKYWNGSAWVTI